MNYQYLNRLDKEVPYLKNKYNKILYLYEYKKGDTLKYYSEVNKISYIDVNLYLSEKLMDVKPNRRPYKVIDLMNSLGDNDDDIICLDYFEILFEPSLKLQPFDILKNLSRSERAKREREEKKKMKTPFVEREREQYRTLQN